MFGREAKVPFKKLENWKPMPSFFDAVPLREKNNIDERHKHNSNASALMK